MILIEGDDGRLFYDGTIEMTEVIGVETGF